MAGPQVELLTQEYRRESLALRAKVIRELVKVWPLFRVADIDGSWSSLESVLRRLVLEGRRDVALIAGKYLADLRRMDGVSGGLNVTLDDAVPQAVLDASLRVTGPVAVKTAIANGATEALAVRRGLVALTGSMSRIVLDGGRNTILLTVENDRKAVGYIRRTHGKTCAFCAMLASRGPIYKSRKTAGDPRGRPARFHDHCDCTIEPIYRESSALPDSTRRYQQLWIDSTVGLGGQEARNAFRVAYDASL